MVALLSIYEEEDEAYQDLVTVATTFFQYLLQPFRDMRELACLYKMEILVNAHIYLAAVGIFLGYGNIQMMQNCNLFWYLNIEYILIRH